MKRIFLTLTFVALFAFSASAQEKWRTLTFTAVSNASTQTQTFLPQFSAALDYELVENFSVVSWSGFSYNTTTDTSWFASQTTLDKRIGGFTVGLGYLYTTNGVDIFAPIGQGGFENDFFLSMKFQYRIKL